MSVYVEDDEVFTPILVEPRGRHRSGGSKIYLNTSPTGGRARSVSKGAQPQEQRINLNVIAPSERSHSRERHRRRHSRKCSTSSESSSHCSRHSRDRSRRRSSRYDPDDIDALPYNIRKELEQSRREKEAREEQERAAAAKREKEKWEANFKEREKEEKRKKDRLLEEAFQEQERQKKEEKRRRELILEEARLEEERQKKEEKRRRELILEEARREEERQKKEESELRKKILEEEEEKKRKEKLKKEEEEREIEAKLRERLKASGYSDERIDRMLREKRKPEDGSKGSWAVDLSRPTFIKVHRKYLSPDTLNYFNLPWEWDSNTEYLVIKKYIDDDEQDMLFDHTRSLRLKERKVITSGYEKDVTVKLKPTTTSVIKDSKDRMYVVREKSKSPGRSRSRSRTTGWIFT